MLKSEEFELKIKITKIKNVKQVNRKLEDTEERFSEFEDRNTEIYKLKYKEKIDWKKRK